MKFEVPLLIDLGFEVFVPKKFPNHTDFRSSITTFIFDATLTIPKNDLEQINNFDFYLTKWPDNITKIVNKYFDLSFIMPSGIAPQEVVKNFLGDIFLRAFGLDKSSSYKYVLEHQCGKSFFSEIKKIENRFYFAPCYENLGKIEPPIIANQTVYLPIGLPKEYWGNKNTWTGGDNRILFVCPNLITEPYYANIYKNFKDNFGHLSHVIIGKQDVHVDDPCVLGFVDDDKLSKLFKECSVLYYHSQEPRHLHYHPLEASLRGMPVVFHRDSLIGSLTNLSMLGRVENVKEALSAVERILSGDKEYIDILQQSQQSLCDSFSYAYCKKIWITNFANKYRQTGQNTHSNIQLANEKTSANHRPLSSFDMGIIDTDIPGQINIDFSCPLPWFIANVVGISNDGNLKGRWTHGSTCSIDFINPLPKYALIKFVAFAYRNNAGAIGTICLDDQCQKFVVHATDPANATEIQLPFMLNNQNINNLKLLIPHPEFPPEDPTFALGYGLLKLSIEELSASQYQDSLNKTVELDFSCPLPWFIANVGGFHEIEQGGRYTAGTRSTIHLASPLPKRVLLQLTGSAYRDNIGVPIIIKIGKYEKSVVFNEPFGVNSTVNAEFSLDGTENLIEINTPYAVCPPQDERLIGLHLKQLNVILL